jgi:2,4-didehydro-3-deoxy-L-rhamnonate hydrolase
MRIANADGRLALVTAGHVIDVAEASDGWFGPDVQDVYGRWTEFLLWSRQVTSVGRTPLGEVRLGPVAPRPRQIFAIGLNYHGHAVETGLDIPDAPMVFTKFASSIAGSHDAVALPTESVDFEAELVVVIGALARQVARADAWRHVAGLTVGQDISERELLVRPPTPQQFSLAKSFPNFAPIGPVLVTPHTACPAPAGTTMWVGLLVNSTTPIQLAVTTATFEGMPGVGVDTIYHPGRRAATCDRRGPPTS